MKNIYSNVKIRVNSRGSGKWHREEKQFWKVCFYILNGINISRNHEFRVSGGSEFKRDQSQHMKW